MSAPGNEIIYLANLHSLHRISICLQKYYLGLKLLFNHGGFNFAWHRDSIFSAQFSNLLCLVVQAFELASFVPQLYIDTIGKDPLVFWRSIVPVYRSLRSNFSL